MNRQASPAKRVVIKSDPYRQLDDAMQFRLLYDGTLLGASRTDTRARHKHDIRRVFHQQLKRLWTVDRHLAERGREPKQDSNGVFIAGESYIEYLAQKFTQGEWRCVPLVHSEYELACGIEILFLRYDQPGATLIQSGDIDNRLKTIFDALRRPQNAAEIFGSPSADEQPFYCLLEDDKLIDHVAVTTDYLLQPNRDVNDVHLVIEVKVRPVHATMGNIDFGF